MLLALRNTAQPRHPFRFPEQLLLEVFQVLLSVPEFHIVAADVLRLRRKSKIGLSGFSVVVVVVSIQAFLLGHVQGE